MKCDRRYGQKNEDGCNGYADKALFGRHAVDFAVDAHTQSVRLIERAKHLARPLLIAVRPHAEYGIVKKQLPGVAIYKLSYQVAMIGDSFDAVEFANVDLALALERAIQLLNHII